MHLASGSRTQPVDNALRITHIFSSVFVLVLDKMVLVLDLPAPIDYKHRLSDCEGIAAIVSIKWTLPKIVKDSLGANLSWA